MTQSIKVANVKICFERSAEKGDTVFRGRRGTVSQCFQRRKNRLPILNGLNYEPFLVLKLPHPNVQLTIYIKHFDSTLYSPGKWVENDGE